MPEKTDMPTLWQGRHLSAERMSTLLGLVFVMGSAMPGYWLLDDYQRLNLVGVALAGVAALAAFCLWRMPKTQRRRLGRLGLQLLACFMIGCTIMSIWSELSADVRRLPQWATMLPAGMTTGLLLHVVVCWWRGSRQPD